MSSEGVIASDATKNDFHDDHPNGFSAISVAIAIEDQESFNKAYFEIVREKLERYNIKSPTPIIKDKYINRYVPLWKQEEARRDIVLDLLSIDELDTIYVTETYLKPRWIDLYEDDDDAQRRMISNEFVEDVLFQYYDIISIWKYLRRYSHGNSAYTNVMTDDFSGHISGAYEEIGEMCDNFAAIPYGDITYPALSLADLTTGLLKQEVYPLRKDDIEDYIKDDTPAYVVAESVHNSDLDMIVPKNTEDVRTDLLRPDPTIHIYRGDDMDKKRLYTLDVFKYACMYAQQQGGCVKLLEESNDRYHFTDDDLLICLDDTTAQFSDYHELNSKYSITVLGRNEAVDFLVDNLDSEYVL